MPKPMLTMQPFTGLKCEVCAAKGKKTQTVYCRALTSDVEETGRSPGAIFYDESHGGPDLVCEAHVDAPFPANDKAGRALA